MKTFFSLSNQKPERATGNDHNLSISSRFEDYLPNDVSSIYPPFKVAEDESPTSVMEPVTFPLPKSISVRSRGYLKMSQDPAAASSGVDASEIRSLNRSSRIASPLNASERKLTEVEMQKDGSATRNDHNLSIAFRFEDYLPNDFSSIYPSFNPYREPARSSLMQYQDPINLTVQCLTRLNDTTREVETLRLEKETLISVIKWMIRLVCASEIRSLTRSSRIASPLNASEPSMGASNSDQEYERAFEAELVQEVEVRGTPRRDWTTQGIIVPTIRNQHSMNTCWAFVTATSLEYIRKLTHPSENQIAFSAQQLIDCCVPDPDGTRFDPVKAYPYTLRLSFQWVNANGIVTRDTYPDETMMGKCRCLPEATRYFRNMVELIEFSSGDQNRLNMILDRHPVIGTILVSRGFEHLGPNDIYYGPPIGARTFRHGVVLMGYETFQGVEVIIFQNSYGMGWGSNGIGRFARYKEVNGQKYVGSALSGISYPVLL